MTGYGKRSRFWWASGRLSVNSGLALMWLVIPGLVLGWIDGWGRLPWALVIAGSLTASAFQQSRPYVELVTGNQRGPAIEQIPELVRGKEIRQMTDSALDDDDQRPDQVVSIPDDAQFLRAADEVCDGSDLVAPVPIYAAQRGDIVVMSNQRVGTYLGSGKMLLDSLAIDDDDRSSR